MTGITPASGLTTGGTAVTITGTNLTGTTAVTIGGSAATGVTVVNATTITATTPAHAAGATDVVVTTPAGTGTGTGLFTYAAAPTVTTISPTSGPTAGGNSVIITGTNLTDASEVKFGATNATGYTVNSATQITATPPAGAGIVDVTVTTAGGTSGTSAADQYTYVAAPTITGISPSSGSDAGGTPVTITGTNLLDASSVTIGGTLATNIIVVDATTIFATTPAHAAGAVNVVVITPGGTATGTNLFTYVAAPTVTSLSTNNGPLAGGTSVVITGANLTDATAVTFGATNATAYTVNSATEIIATAPAGSAGTVDVTVTTAGGTSATGAADQYTYVAPPSVSSLSPTAGPTAGSNSVVITGTNLLAASAVKFGATNATGYTINSPTQITATAPAGSVGTVDITVTTAGGTSATGAADQYSYVAAPTITGISPSSGSDAGGTSVTITGTNLNGASAVKFGASLGTITGNTLTQIIATAPAGSGTVHITATTAGGTSATSASDQYTYVAAPAVSSVSPANGPIAGGTSVTITGANFVGLSGAAAVKFGSNNATSYTVDSATQITATAPPGSAGTVHITVTTPIATSSTGAGDQFTYVAAPAVTAVLPASGPTAGGTSVVITGSNFVGLSGAAAVKFGANNATSYSVDSATQITAVSPAGSAGMVDITVVAVGGTSATGSSDRFTYAGIPTVTAIAPISGTTGGGTSVTITGTNLTGASLVTIGGTSATGITVVNASTITATTPAHAAGAVDVVVITPGGPATGTNLFTYVAAPTVTSLSTNNGPLAGGTSVVITGTGFVNGDSNVKFGTTSATSVTVNSTTQITVSAPAHAAGLVDVTVTTAGGSSTTGAGDQFTYVGGPTVSSISPNSGSSAGGTSVTITGSNFVGVSGAAAVKFGANNATSYTVDSATQITAVAPAGSAGIVDITVVAVGGTSATGSSDRFTYVGIPTITAIAPISGTTGGGTSVTITGTNLTGASSVTIGGTAATGITVVNASTITATTPAHAAGAVNVVVITPGGTATGPNLFTYVVGPTVTSLSPSSGGIGGGASITITGTNLTGASSVKFGTTVVGSFTVNSDTQITTTVPAHAAGVVNVTVTTAGGNSPAAAGNQYSYIPPAPIAGNVSMKVEIGSSNNVVPLALTGGAVASVTVATAPSHGTATASGTVITYTPTAGYSGTDSFTYTATNAGGTSPAGTVSILVQSRPDPTKDAEVIALLNAQVQTAKRFSQTQIGNFQTHLEGLHTRSQALLQEGPNRSSRGGIARTPAESTATSLTEFSSGTNTGTAANSPSALFSPRSAKFGADARCQTGNMQNCMATGGMRPAGDGMDSLVLGAQTSANTRSDWWPWPTLSVSGSSKDLLGSGMNVWSAGTVNVGKQSESDTRFTTSGISVGGDNHVTDKLILGVGAGFGHERQKIGSNDSKNRGDSYSIVAYGSYQPEEGFFVDGLIGYGHLAFDAERYVTATGEFAQSERKGSQWFSSLSGGYEYVEGKFLFSPYGRLDLIHTRLDETAETGAGTSNLTYLAQTSRSTKLSLGMRGETTFEIDKGTIKPSLRVEYQHDFAEPGVANMMYSDDLNGTVYRLDMENTDQNTMVLGLGLDFALRKSWQTGLSYKFSHSSSSSSQMQSFGVYLRRAF